MSRNYEIESLREREQEAFNRKQSLWDKLQMAKERTNEAYVDMQAAWEDLNLAREEMNREYERKQTNWENNQSIWDEYGRIRDANNAQIESLKYEADAEHREMQRCFEQASYEYEYGDRSMASAYSQEGHEHQDQRDALNDEIRELGAEVKEAKQRAQMLSSDQSGDDFRAAKERFHHAKDVHKSAQALFKISKKKRNSLKEEFETANDEHKRLKEQLQNLRRETQERNSRVKAEKARKRERILDKAGIYGADRKNAVIKAKSDGTVQVYSGGLGEGDGYGHGHVVIDKTGQISYDRKAFKAHGSQNYTDSKNSGWSPLERGTIGNHEVSFRMGTGSYEGQVLIRDGFVSKNEFDTGHNHYGDNDKTKYPDEPDRIEDSSKHRDDHFYTGPGA